MKVSWRDEMKCQVSTSFSTIDLTDSCDIPETPQSSYGSPLDLPETPIRKTVFLVRHGEALHNIAEKSALQEACEQRLPQRGCEERSLGDREEICVDR